MERSKVISQLKRYEPELIEIRHDIHQHPETGFEEVRTAKVVADHLREWGSKSRMESPRRASSEP